MTIENVLASVAVKDLDAATAWYAKLLGRPSAPRPMKEVAEWTFPRGGVLQVYELPERAGRCSCTLSVSDLDAEVAKLEAMGVDTSQRTSGPQVKTVMIVDPDGNHIALAQPLGDAVAR